MERVWLIGAVAWVLLFFSFYVMQLINILMHDSADVRKKLYGLWQTVRGIAHTTTDVFEALRRGGELYHAVRVLLYLQTTRPRTRLFAFWHAATNIEELAFHLKWLSTPLWRATLQCMWELKDDPDVAEAITQLFSNFLSFLSSVAEPALLAEIDVEPVQELRRKCAQDDSSSSLELRRHLPPLCEALQLDTNNRSNSPIPRTFSLVVTILSHSIMTNCQSSFCVSYFCPRSTLCVSGRRLERQRRKRRQRGGSWKGLGRKHHYPKSLGIVEHGT